MRSFSRPCIAKLHCRGEFIKYFRKDSMRLYSTLMSLIEGWVTLGSTMYFLRETRLMWIDLSRMTGLPVVIHQLRISSVAAIVYNTVRKLSKTGYNHVVLYQDSQTNDNVARPSPRMYGHVYTFIFGPLSPTVHWTSTEAGLPTWYSMDNIIRRSTGSSTCEWVDGVLCWDVLHEKSTCNYTCQCFEHYF